MGKFTDHLPQKKPLLSSPLTPSTRNLRKVNLLLQAFDKAGKHIEYFALDLDRKELERTLGQLPAYQHVRSHGLWGTYDDGREWLKQPFNTERQKCVLSLGSSIGKFVFGWTTIPAGYRLLRSLAGNFHRDEASDFLRGFASVLSPGDLMLVGVDSCSDPCKV